MTDTVIFDWLIGQEKVTAVNLYDTKSDTTPEV